MPEQNHDRPARRTTTTLKTTTTPGAFGSGLQDGEGGYSWGGVNGTPFWLDPTNDLFAIFMVQTRIYKASTYGTFKSPANESGGIASGRGVMAGRGGGGGAEASGSQFQQRDKDGDVKLDDNELPAALFDRLDVSKDGFVTEEEAKASLQRP